MKVYIIDEDPFYQTIVENELFNCKVYKIKKFTDAEEAIQEMQKDIPKLVLVNSDVKGFCKKAFKERLEKIDDKIFLVTMSSDNEQLFNQEALNPSVVRHLTKNGNIYTKLKKIIIEVYNYFTFYKIQVELLEEE